MDAAFFASITRESGSPVQLAAIKSLNADSTSGSDIAGRCFSFELNKRLKFHEKALLPPETAAAAIGRARGATAAGREEAAVRVDSAAGEIRSRRRAAAQEERRAAAIAGERDRGEMEATEAERG